ncbi:hypothetical protein FisN_2Hh513 [Fistulifera solaris]|uniref:monogalactosyldiacylglycerol synthase n=1 Tax=Fistulifera solaris TaxID=1519565 RepID=A0A1Z5JGA0_FISSO|nr:hypothetical protein FisN_2Hh513 [Fistulifera solaris]|eukprot:GAX13030.1 hypothetical protein FisN_2Hh513 [Fistulifera solaris]
MRRPIWCPSWCFLFLAFTRNGVSLTSAWGWKRSIGASQRSNLLITSESDTSLSLTKSDHLPRGGAVLNETSLNDAGKVAVEDPAENRGPLRVLFLSADTGGGHRASAESLAKQFLIHYPGSNYELLDIWTPCGVYPYRTLVPSYQHLSASPKQWRVLYHASNTLPWEILMDLHSTFLCEKGIRKRIAEYDPDVIVSVHPAMNYAPMRSAQKLSKLYGKHIPFFTVVTDLGSGHATWFQKNVDKLYLASERLYRLAKRRGGTPDDRIVMTGLPIRHDFTVQADLLGRDRYSAFGKEYQKQVRLKLLPGVDPEKPVILLMGGGEGVGALSEIVDELYTTLVLKGVDATICVICGRNEKLKDSLNNRDWSSVSEKLAAGNRNKRRKKRSRWFGKRPPLQPIVKNEQSGKVDVIGLGFLTNIAEYMVASTILLSKAGPGTIAEAASVGLPILMTSFLPGQEAGNVDFAVEKGFGEYCDEPVYIAEIVSQWLEQPDLIREMSQKAHAVGHPEAASEIVQDIGSITHTWKVLNKQA